MRLSTPFLIAALAASTSISATPADKPPLTKQQEREQFHPSRLGMDAATRLAGYARRQEMEQATPLAGLRFRNVGPEIQGGRIVDIAAPPGAPDALIVAFASGGLWRTDNRGGSWTPLFDRESSLTIGAIALGDAAGKVLYVGTGEANSSRTSYAGTGVFGTQDGGKTWKHLGLADSHHIARIAVDPRDSRTLYVAAMGHLYTENQERGVYRSTDAGATWERVLFVDTRTGAIDLALDPSRPGVVYTTMWERARTAANFLESGPGSGIHKSTDGGRTWTRLSGGFPQGATVGRIGLALAASRPDTLYAVLDNQALRPDSEPEDEDTPPGELTPRRLRALSAEAFARLDDGVVARFLRRNDFPKPLKPAPLKRDVKAGKITVADLVAYLQDANRSLFEKPIAGSEVYRSDDGGASWRRTHEKRIEQVFYSYGYYFGRIVADPQDPERVYFGGVPMLGSTDGGKTWRGLDRPGVHGDHHALYIDPRSPNRLALGTDGGLNLSFDHGETWFRVNNLPVGQFTTVAVDDEKPYNILGGLQDNGVMRGPSTYKPGKSEPDSWKEIYGGDGATTVVDPKDSNLIYTGFQFGFSARLNLKTGERARIRPRPELSAEKKERPLRYNWVTPFLLSPHSRDLLYYGANRVYRSFDRGETWTALSGDLTSDAEQGDVPFGTITSLAESPKRFGVLYAGTDEGKLWGTRDGGVNWTDLSAGLAKGKWVTRVVASAFDEGTVYLAQNGYRDDDFAAYLFRSSDYGRTWESLAGGLPAEPINIVREDPKGKHLLYLGTDMGVFVSLDHGATWQVLTGGLPHVPVHDLAVQTREGDLVVGTHGRSVFVAEAAPLRKLTSEVMTQPLHAFAVKPAQGSWTRGYGEHPYYTWFREDPLVRVAFWAKAAGPLTLTVKDEHGSVWKDLTGTAAAGLNAVEYDLSADPQKADAAEAVARAKAAEKAKAEKGKSADKTKGDSGEQAKPAADAAEDEDEAEEAKGDQGNAAPPAVVDADLAKALADPLRHIRRRFLPPGSYTLELRLGAATAKTTLKVKPPKAGPSVDDEAPGSK
jgi:photosystem II stability/assembly factor-like uncharacterized protein/predicted  nucleic acid-binding Zn-ribbon protein